MKIKVNYRYKSKILLLKTTKLFKKDLEIFKDLFAIHDIRFVNSFLKIKGINYSTALHLINKVGVSPFTKTNKLKKFKKNLKHIFYNIIDQKTFNIDNAVWLQKKINIRKLTTLSNNRGIRHLRFLPVNGQNTYSNAKTRKKHKIN